MADTIHDSALISIDTLTFKYAHRRRFGAYLVVVTSDTLGRVTAHTTPLTYPVLHRPRGGRPAVIDFGFDGFPIYSSVGKVPDLVRFDVLLVRDRRSVRNAGELLEKIASSDALKAALVVAKVALVAASAGTAAIGAAVSSAMAPVLGLVGEIIAETEDKVIERFSGSKIFDAAVLAKDEISDTVLSPTGNLETVVDIMLFDSRREVEVIEELENVEVKLDRDDTSAGGATARGEVEPGRYDTSAGGAKVRGEAERGEVARRPAAFSVEL